MRYLVLALVLVTGCGKKAEPDTDPARGDGSPEAKGGRPSDGAGSAGGRELRATTRHKIVKAFSDNPQRAKREFAGNRWRFHVRIDKIGDTQLVTGVVFSGDVGAATITMRSSREVEKLSRSKPAIVEAAVGEYVPGELYPFHFEDGVFVEVASEPALGAPLEGEQELTTARLKDLIEVFDRGDVWARKRYPGRWSFKGTVVKRTTQLGSSYIIDVPGVGNVEVAFPGGESPKVGAAVNLDAVATRLNFDQDDKPLLVFSAPKRR